MSKILLVLDSPFGDLTVEENLAAESGWEVLGWSGDPEELALADAVLHVRCRVDAALLDLMPRCRVVGRFGTGLDSVDLDECAARDIRVVNVSDYCTPELSSHTIALALLLDRRLGDAAARHPDTDWSTFASEHRIVGRTSALVIGAGVIGRAVGRALLGLQMSVSYVSEHGDTTLADAGARRVGLHDGLAESEIVFIHRAQELGGPPLVTGDFLASMTQGALLVNTARLSLLDEEAVALAVEAGSLGGVALDGHLTAASPLRRLLGRDDFICTPHIGWYSERSALLLRTQATAQTIGWADDSVSI